MRSWIQIVAEYVERVYSKLGTGFGKALFLTAYDLEKYKL